MLFYGGESAVLTFYAAERMGLRVPDQLSLISTGESPIPCLHSTLDTMIIPFYEIGRVAVRQLLEKIEHPAQSLPTRTLPFTLVPGETVAHALA
jgi:DNA-binding LacI/PurR family transcriptional regulator